MFVLTQQQQRYEYYSGVAEKGGQIPGRSAA